MEMKKKKDSRAENERDAEWIERSGDVFACHSQSARQMKAVGTETEMKNWQSGAAILRIPQAEALIRA